MLKKKHRSTGRNKGSWRTITKHLTSSLSLEEETQRVACVGLEKNWWYPSPPQKKPPETALKDITHLIKIKLVYKSSLFIFKAEDNLL